MRIAANGIELEYEIFGPAGGVPLLLIMGFSVQLTHWPDALLRKLVAKGFRVIVFDNRDIGLSTNFDAAGAPDFAAIFAGQAKPAYTLNDMADDAAGLLDALKIGQAHVVGMSMGGIIAQIMAARHADHVLSLTAIMTTTNAPGLPPPVPEAIQAMARPAAGTIDAFVEWSIRMWSAIGSPGNDYTTPAERERFRRIAERSIYLDGLSRQIAAIAVTGDIRGILADVRAPTVVIHGQADPLVNIAAGRDIAEHIKGARFVTIPGMGHDFPPFALDRMADEIKAVSASAH